MGFSSQPMQCPDLDSYDINIAKNKFSKQLFFRLLNGHKGVSLHEIALIIYVINAQ